MQNNYRVFEETIEHLKNDPRVEAISLIGSAAHHYPRLDDVKDIDLLVLLAPAGIDSREVNYIASKEYDISYKSRDLIESFIDARHHYWLDLLVRARHIYKGHASVDELFKLANAVYSEGPTPLSEQDITQLRFDLTKKLEDLAYRKDKVVTFQYLAGIYMEMLCQAYFRLHNTWLPRRKKMMQVIAERDRVLYELIKTSYQARQTSDHYALLEKIHAYILEPYGGELNTLKVKNTLGGIDGYK